MTSQVTYFAITTAEPERAHAFYGGLLGWEVGPAAAPGALHVKNVAPTGGLHPGPGAPAITVYFGVEDIALAVARVRELGGEASEPMNLPTGPIAHCADDQGVAFGLHQPPD